MRHRLNIGSTSAKPTVDMPHVHPTAEVQFDSAVQTLRENHHRVTEPRKAMLRILTQEHGPFTAEEVHRRMEKGSCDLVTVYRSLTAMEEINVVRRCDFGDGSYRYEINTGEHHHHHIICRVCHGVTTLDLCVADGLERIARQMGYAKVTHMLEIFGVCPECQTLQAP
jgi:Fur family ferric uptake transcriptional regulator